MTEFKLLGSLLILAAGGGAAFLSARTERRQLTVLDGWIAENPHFYYTRPQAGTTALVYYDFDVPSYEFCKRLYDETGAFVTPGDCFEQPRSMRIGYAYGKEALVKGLKAVSSYFAWKEKELEK